MDKYCTLDNTTKLLGWMLIVAGTATLCILAAAGKTRRRAGLRMQKRAGTIESFTGWLQLLRQDIDKEISQ